MKRKERIGIFGGTFDPPHLGHINALRAFYDQLGLDRAYVVPAGIPPHKRINHSDDPLIRMRMAEVAFIDDLRSITVSDFEISKPGYSYTFETLEHFSKRNRELFLLCGTDMFQTIGKWRMPEIIFSLATIVCMPRTEDYDQMNYSISEEYKLKYNAKCIILEGNIVEVSSSMIREMISNGEYPEKYVTSSVMDIIKTEELYGWKNK